MHTSASATSFQMKVEPNKKAADKGRAQRNEQKESVCTPDPPLPGSLTCPQPRRRPPLLPAAIEPSRLSPCANTLGSKKVPTPSAPLYQIPIGVGTFVFRETRDVIAYAHLSTVSITRYNLGPNDGQLKKERVTKQKLAARLGVHHYGEKTDSKAHPTLGRAVQNGIGNSSQLH